MARVIWMPPALRQIEAIWLFIARESESRADQVTDRLWSAAQGLSDFPESGRIVPEFERQDLREILVLPYRVIYRLDRDYVEIIAVYHAAQQIEESDLPL